MTITRYGPASERPREGGYLFVAPHGYPHQAGGAGQPGYMIMDWTGEIVWFFSPIGPTVTEIDNLGLQFYQGKPVLVWWGGEFIINGQNHIATGAYTIADASYTTLATVNAVGAGFSADNHECLLTPQGTAVIIARRVAAADLTPIGGPVNGQVLDCAVQEIDVATGDLLFQWDALEQLPLDETLAPYTPPFAADPHHFNSVAIAPDGDLLVSARNTWTVYKVSRSTGAIVWRLGGTKSDFAMGPDASFAWQHDVRALGDRVLSIFDDEAAPQEGPQSRAIFLDLDTRAMRASLIRQYTHPGGLLAVTQGSAQVLDGGRVLVGWGDLPYFSEFAPDGRLLLDGQFPTSGGSMNEVDQSYRALSFDWTGLPTETPAAAVTPGNAGGAVVYASWNGATEVARWAVLAGQSPSALPVAGWGKRTGFETSVPVSSTGPYFVAVALDKRGRELGRSDPVTLSVS